MKLLSRWKKPIIANLIALGSFSIIVPSAVIIAKRIEEKNEQQTIYNGGVSTLKDNPYANGIVPDFNEAGLMNVPFSVAKSKMRLSLKEFPGYLFGKDLKTGLKDIDDILMAEDKIPSEKLFYLINDKITKLNIELIINKLNGKTVYTDFGPLINIDEKHKDDKGYVISYLQNHISSITKKGHFSSSLFKSNVKNDELFIRSTYFKQEFGKEEVDVAKIINLIKIGKFTSDWDTFISILNNSQIYFKRQIKMTAIFNKFVTDIRDKIKFADPDYEFNVQRLIGEENPSAILPSIYSDPAIPASKKPNDRYIDGMRKGGDTGVLDSNIFWESGHISALNVDSIPNAHSFQLSSRQLGQTQNTGMPLNWNSTMFDILSYNKNDDSDFVFNKSRVPLNKKLFFGKELNKSQGLGDFTLFGQGSEMFSGNDDYNPATWKTAKYNIHWQYVNRYITWPGNYYNISLPEATLVDTAHRNGAKVFGTIFNEKNFDMLGGMLTYRDGKNLLIQKLIEIAKARGFDGWYFNWETWFNGVYPEMVSFLRQWYDELVVEFHKAGLEQEIYFPNGTEKWNRSWQVGQLPVDANIDFASPSSFALYNHNREALQGTSMLIGNNYFWDSDPGNAKKTIMAARAIAEEFGFNFSLVFYLSESIANGRQARQRNMFDGYYKRQQEVWNYQKWTTSTGSDPIADSIKRMLGIDNDFEKLDNSVNMDKFWGGLEWFAGSTKDLERDMDFFTSNNYFGMKGTPGFDPTYFKNPSRNSPSWWADGETVNYVTDSLSPVPFQSRDPRIDIGNSIARFFREKSVLNKPLSTSFDRGFGYKIFANGKAYDNKIANTELQSILPTYNWIIDRYHSNGEAYDIKKDHYTQNTIKMGYSTDDAWFGHNSLRYSGSLKPGEHIENILYASDYSSPKIKLTVKGTDSIKLIVSDGNKKIISPSSHKDLANGWKEFSFNTSGKVEQIGVNIENTTTSNFDLSKVYLGAMSIDNDQSHQNLAIMDNLQMSGWQNNLSSTSMRLSWDGYDEDLIYQIYDVEQEALLIETGRNAAFIRAVRIDWDGQRHFATGTLHVKVFTRDGRLVGTKEVNFKTPRKG